VMQRKKVKWGVLGAASIAVTTVIPAMRTAEWCEVIAIASRDKKKAEEAARMLGIAKAYGSYAELLADLLGAGAPDPVDVGEADRNPLLTRNVDASNTRHERFSLKSRL
jgi:predicted dehydrogenase